ncbi:U3 small nucleolar RNA-associated protein 17 [Ceratocystis platani]|uniref:U3 small nucleolar RNA-associated protein 17 n=1 Tax=Ceratocystis fimbriata f. sp. platani TaxID=88771 RepID=A0A0F8BPL9_CERFI|nr:U3 small nucleolar RNA-associated protein 17 [Ceratocystis platani]
MAGSAVSATTLKRKHLGESKSQKKRQRPVTTEAIVDRTLVTSKSQDEVTASDSFVSPQVQSEWTVSKAAGGRMVDIDPILTEDQRFLIVPYTTSIQIYSTADSLLVRRIPMPSPNRNLGIVGLRQCLTDPSMVWVACANGIISKVNWTGESETPIVASIPTASGTASSLATLLVSVGDSDAKKTSAEVVLVAEMPTDHSPTRVIAYDGELRLLNVLLKLAAGMSRLHTMETLVGAGLVYASAGKQFYLGTPRSLELASLDELAYEFYTFACEDLITATDARIVPLSRSKKGSSKQQHQQQMSIDVAIGCARGPIYCYSDILTRLQAMDAATATASKGPRESLQPKKMHWHRRAVHSLKWSRDGNYLVSGGSEHTLVLWQLDTNKQSFLPHLTGIIENIVVSASGSAYVVHLDDNSVMVLSSAQLEPTAYISGVQSAVYVNSALKDHLVPRIGEKYSLSNIDVVMALNPAAPERMYLCVGDGLQASRNGSKPYLQSVDLSSMRSIGKQAIARTSLTANNTTPSGATIIDPEIKHMAFSCDGKWLATIDEWMPPSNSQTDLGASEGDSELRKERREVFLKIWDAETAIESESQENAPLPLVSRINTPHETSHPESVLDLAADPQNARFATLGRDGIARIWKPRPRQRDGLAIKDDRGKELHTWICDIAVTVNHRQSIVAMSGADYSRIEGRLSFADDGSCLVAAFGAGDEGSIHVIDAHTGHIRYSWDDLWRGSLHGLQLLGPYVIVLSHDLRVFDMVADSLVYGLPLSNPSNLDSSSGAANLAIDRMSRHFAVSLRHTEGSELLIFSPNSMEPLLSHHFESRIAALSASAEPHTSGFLVLDNEAQVFTVSQASNDNGLVVARSLDEMQLDAVEEKLSTNGVELLDASDDEDEGEPGQNGKPEAMDIDTSDAMEIDVDEDSSSHPAIINQHQLSDIFDAAPTYAMVPLEDLFLKVAALLANKPVGSA